MADLKMMLQNLRDKSKCCKKDDFTGERYTIIHDISIETLNMICEDGIEQLENAQRSDDMADTYYSAGIKVCPFCEDGGRMSMIETVNGQHYVQCDKCGASREKILADTDGAAIDIWNARYMKKEK